MSKLTRYIIITLVVFLAIFVLIKMKDRADSFFYNDTKSIPNNDLIATTTQSSATTVKSYVNISDNVKPKVDPSISIDGIINYTNIERKKAGLQPLVKNTKLNISASAKVDDMFARQYFEHNSPTGESAADLVRAVSYKFQIVGENLALGMFDTDKFLVDAWMNSPTHRENILNPKYTEMGAAVGISNYKGQTQWMAVQHFAKPTPLCTQIDENTQMSIDIEKSLLETEERELQKMAGVIETNIEIEKEYIDNYNIRVGIYNQRLNKLRESISDFNSTIVEYNSCVKK